VTTKEKKRGVILAPFSGENGRREKKGRFLSPSEGDALARSAAIGGDSEERGVIAGDLYQRRGKKFNDSSLKREKEENRGQVVPGKSVQREDVR